MSLSGVNAATVYVNTTGDDFSGNGSVDNPFQTIQKGHDNATDGDTIIIADGQYTGAGNNHIVIGHSITINGQSQTGTIINGVGNDIFHISTGCNVIIQNLTITASGRAINNHGNLTVNDCTLTGNLADEGGSICNYYGGTLTVNNCTLTGNTANHGGAIWNLGICTLSDCTLTGNKANREGGAICNYYGTLIATNCIFNDNTAHSSHYGGGGAIFNYYGGTCTVTNCIFNDNIAGGQWGSGGAICNYYNGIFHVIGCNFTGNSASGSEYGNGGAIFNSYGTCTVNNSIFTNNTAHLTTLLGVNFINYIDMYLIDGYGGDICNGANLDVIGCIFNGNHAVDIPGGIFHVLGGVMNFNLNRILGNTNIMCWGTANWGLNWYVPASLMVTITGPTTVIAGNTITYTLNVTNNGQGPANNVQIQENIPLILQNVIHDSFNLGTIDEGSSKIVTITGKVPSSVSMGTIIENSATVTSSTPATITPSSTINTTVSTLSNIHITTLPDKKRPNVGSTVTFTVTVHNNGPSDANNIQIRDMMPNGFTEVNIKPSKGSYNGSIWTLNLINGEEATLNLTGKVSADMAGKNITNTALLVGSSNSARTIIYVPKSKLSIKTKISTNNLKIGEKFVLTYKLENKGPDTAYNVTITIPLPDGFEVSGISGDGKWTYNAKTNVITWFLGSASVGNSQLFISGHLNHLGTYVFDSYVSAETFNINTRATTPIKINAVAEVKAGNSPSKLVGMQETGIPILGLILAILAVFGGFVSSKRK